MINFTNVFLLTFEKDLNFADQDDTDMVMRLGVFSSMAEAERAIDELREQMDEYYEDPKCGYEGYTFVIKEFMINDIDTDERNKLPLKFE